MDTGYRHAVARFAQDARQGERIHGDDLNYLSTEQICQLQMEEGGNCSRAVDILHLQTTNHCITNNK